MAKTDIHDRELRARVIASVRHWSGPVLDLRDDAPPRLEVRGVREEAAAAFAASGVSIGGARPRLLTVPAGSPASVLVSDVVMLADAHLRAEVERRTAHLDLPGVHAIPTLDPDLIGTTGTVCPGRGIDDDRLADLLDRVRGDLVVEGFWLNDHAPILVDPGMEELLRGGLDDPIVLPDEPDLAVSPIDAFLLPVDLRGPATAPGIDATLAQARDLLAVGATEGLQVLRTLQAMDPEELDATGRYQLAVGPALLTGLAPTGMVSDVERIAALRHVAAVAVPGTLAADTAARRLMTLTREAGRRAAARERTATSGPERRRWRAQRRRAAGALLSGLPTGDGSSVVTLGQTMTPAYDVTRALASAFRMGTSAGTYRGTVAGEPVALFVPDGAPGWFVGSGAAGRILDPQLRFDALGALRDALHSGCHEPVGVYLPGDLWRYDWLLDEARQVASGAIGVEQLLTQLLQILAQLDLAKIDAGAELMDQIREMVAEKLALIERYVGELHGLIDTFMIDIRDALVAAALLRALSRWPHENWWRVAEAAVSALFDGDDVGDAIVNAMLDPLEDDVAAMLADARAAALAQVEDLQAAIRGAAIPTQLIEELRDQLNRVPGLGGTMRDVGAGDDLLIDPAAAGADAIDELMAPLVEAIEGIDLQALLDDAFAIASPVTIPDWVRAIVFAYFAVPFAALILSGVGLFVILIGVEYVIALLGSAFRELSGRVDELMARAERTRAEIERLTNALVAELVDTAMLESVLAIAGTLLDAVEGLLPGDLRSLIRGALTEARDTILRQVHGLSLAAERALFREHLELVEVVPSSGFALPDLPLPDDADAGVEEIRQLPFLGSADPNYTASAQALAALARYEAEIVRRTTTPIQQLTHVLSLRQLVPPATLDLLLQGLPVDVEIRPETLARVAPGLERLLVKDVAVHLDFDTPAEVVQAVQVLGATAVSASGGLADPALDGRLPGGGFPGLPVLAGRQPTGMPLTITQPGRSYVRLKPSAEMVAAYADACGCAPSDGTSSKPQLAGTRLLDGEVAPGGWRMLELNDAPQSLMLSHFDVLDDGLRFVQRESKRTKPFEYRGAIGTWRLQIPALTNGNVVPDLPALRDVRLIVSCTGHHDPTLAPHDQVAPIAVTEPDPVAEADGLLPDLGLPADLGAVLAKLDEVVDAVGALPGQLASLLDTPDLTGLMTDLRDAVTDLSADTDRMVTATNAALTGLLAVATSLERGVGLIPLEATPTIAGSVAAVTFTAAQITTAAANAAVPLSELGDVTHAVVVPIVDVPLLGSSVVWAGTGTLRYDDGGGAPQTATFPIDKGTMLVDLGAFTGPRADGGAWTVELAGTGLTITTVLLGLVAPRTTP